MKKRSRVPSSRMVPLYVAKQLAAHDSIPEKLLRREGLQGPGPNLRFGVCSTGLRMQNFRLPVGRSSLSREPRLRFRLVGAASIAYVSATAIGVMMRLVFVGLDTGLPFDHLLHAHSHTLYFGRCARAKVDADIVNLRQGKPSSTPKSPPAGDFRHSRSGARIW